MNLDFKYIQAIHSQPLKMKALNFLFNFLILTWLANLCQSDGTEKENIVKKLFRKRRSFLKTIPLRKQNLENKWHPNEGLDFQSKVNKPRRVKRQSWNFGKFLPCTNSLGKNPTTNLVDCLGNFNLLWPIRWNFNPITGKSLSEVHIFASTNPQYEDRLFIDLRVQYMKIAKTEHCFGFFVICFFTFRTIYVDNMF